MASNAPPRGIVSGMRALRGSAANIGACLVRRHAWRSHACAKQASRRSATPPRLHRWAHRAELLRPSFGRPRPPKPQDELVRAASNRGVEDPDRMRIRWISEDAALGVE